jgi:hypothetical protein
MADLLLFTHRSRQPSAELREDVQRLIVGWFVIR